MRQLISLCLICIYTGTSSAHTLSADAGLPAQLIHQLSGLHHWPLYLLALVAGVAVVGVLTRAKRSR